MMRAAVVGGAGYAAGELLRLLADHPHVEVTQVTSERLAGKRVDTVHPPLRGRTDLCFTSRWQLDGADVLFAALEHGESSRDFEALRSAAPILVDLSADFRLRDESAYPRWYGWAHPCPQALGTAVYGLAELHRDCIRTAAVIATGGCLATATILARSRSSSTPWSDPRPPARNPPLRRITRIGAANCGRMHPPATATQPRSRRSSALKMADRRSPSRPRRWRRCVVFS